MIPLRQLTAKLIAVRFSMLPLGVPHPRRGEGAWGGIQDQGAGSQILNLRFQMMGKQERKFKIRTLPKRGKECAAGKSRACPPARRKNSKARTLWRKHKCKECGTPNG